jgi:hypothetical protein
MKEEWLFKGAMVPVDMETTAALVTEIKRLIDVVGGLILQQGPDYERGFVDGMSKQAQSSVDKAVNAMAQPAQEPRPWVGLTDEEIQKSYEEAYKVAQGRRLEAAFAQVIEAALRSKNT